jgi:CelD/BcsL family acetyltransferase involved in cellulose biosynthesis
LVKSRGSAITNIERKSRKLEREVGPLRFEWHDPRPQVLDTLRAWKTEQHRRTGVLEIFQHEWVNKMLEQLMRLPSNVPGEPLGFQAPVSTLYAGDHLVALHFGLCTASTLHIWFPAYSEAYGAYSPGNVLLQKMAQAHAAHGGQRIDFGPGEERYKQDFKSDDKPIYEGMISLNPIQASARGLWFKTKKSIRRSRFRSTLEFPLAATRKLRQWLAFR